MKYRCPYCKRERKNYKEKLVLEVGETTRLGKTVIVIPDTEDAKKYVALCTFCGRRTNSHKDADSAIDAYLEGHLYSSENLEVVNRPLDLDTLTLDEFQSFLMVIMKQWLIDVKSAKRKAIATGDWSEYEELFDLDGGLQYLRIFHEDPEEAVKEFRRLA